MIDFVEDFAELGEFMDMPMRSYSSGMRARLAFGMSMGVAFDWYLVDEITAVGDTAFRNKSLNAFQTRLADAGILVTSHSAATIRSYCTSGLVIERGQARYFPDIEEAIAVHEANMAAGGGLSDSSRAPCPAPQPAGAGLCRAAPRSRGRLGAGDGDPARRPGSAGRSGRAGRRAPPGRASARSASRPIPARRSAAARPGPTPGSRASSSGAPGQPPRAGRFRAPDRLRPGPAGRMPPRRRRAAARAARRAARAGRCARRAASPACGAGRLRLRGVRGHRRGGARKASSISDIAGSPLSSAARGPAGAAAGLEPGEELGQRQPDASPGSRLPTPPPRGRASRDRRPSSSAASWASSRRSTSARPASRVRSTAASSRGLDASGPGAAA